MSQTNIQETDCENFVSFSQIGGLQEHIKLLKELVVFPLLYKDVYKKFQLKAPKGVLFYGPPGTGKTLIAGALAKEFSNTKCGNISFFNQNGADILQKWVGESEQNIRKLFAEATRRQPSIIFFDEIDGLIPIRSSRNDHVHTSIVTTLLALMDGLDLLTGVIIIGATNRIDTIDPAFRRSGRFDREIYFPLPAYKARREILDIYVSPWTVKPMANFLSHLADITVGFCGSDLQALCTEAVMTCLRRTYPTIHTSSTKLPIRTKELKVTEKDFLEAYKNIKPATDNTVTQISKLPKSVESLLKNQLDFILWLIRSKYPHFLDSEYKYSIGTNRYAGRLLLIGDVNQGYNYIVPAILHALEHLPTFTIDIQSLFANETFTAQEICVQKMRLAKRNLPSILILSRINEWWDIADESTRAIILSILEDIRSTDPLFVISTITTKDFSTYIPFCCNTHNKILYQMENPLEIERINYFHPIFMENFFIKCWQYCKSVENKESDAEKLILFKNNINRIKIINKQNNNNNLEITNGRKRRYSEYLNNDNIPKKITKLDTNSSVESILSNGTNKLNESVETYITNENFSENLNSFNKEIINEGSSNESHCRSIHTILNRNIRHVNLMNGLLINESIAEKFKYLFNRIVYDTTCNMTVDNLELLNDMLSTTINTINCNYDSVPHILQNIENILFDFESSLLHPASYGDVTSEQ